MLSSIAKFYIISIWQLCGHRVSVAKQEKRRIPASMRFGERAAKPASCQRRQSVFRHASPSTQYTDRHRIKISKFCDSRDMLPSVRFSGVFTFLSMPVTVKLLNHRVNLRAPRHRSRMSKIRRVSNSWNLVAFIILFCCSSSFQSIELQSLTPEDLSVVGQYWSAL